MQKFAPSRLAVCALVLAAAAATAGAARRELQGAAGGAGAAILTGRPAEHGRWPYMVQLRAAAAVPRRSNTKGQFMCHGVLIQPDVVLTTMTCFHLSGRFPEARLGCTATNCTRHYESRQVVAAALHQGWDPSRPEKFLPEANLALLLLDRCSKKSCLRIPTVALPLNPGKSATILGWGATRWADTGVARALMQASLQLMPQSACNLLWRGLVPGNPWWRQPKAICGLTPGTGLCWDDNAAPLVLPGKKPAQDLLLGLGSASECTGWRGSGFTNVGYYRGWIRGGIRVLRGRVPAGAQYIVQRPDRR
ncbi:serine protease 57 [Micractinium conductrix]|uniref:Serine protease 57 n=1 Tax=Micractinium conductrix TaxID=554055 RepID=A0A2P6V1J8_9CHLO|nr:serine protease 57 [Micractinium conductrix]|eukprot:PSC67955.1 serine protease 57 [Micractinium conductrix]